MAKMKSDALLDYAVFQLSPKRSRCKLFVSSEGSTEKLASGLLKPFVSHLQIAEEQVASASQSITLEVGRNAETWFTKGTLERFVRFVSTPEVLELVNTFDAEMSQLEAARRIYAQGAGDQLSGGGGSGVAAGHDATKKELLRAIDVRLVAVQQDLFTACARAAAAGFNIDTVSELQLFADKFGAHRLNDACAKFISLNERRPELTQPWKSGLEDRAVRSSYGSDMSIDDDPPSPPPRQQPAKFQQPDPPAVTFPTRRTFSRESSVDREAGKLVEMDKTDETSTPDQTGSIQASQPGRRLSVQDRINMFENKQKDTSGGKPVLVKPVELRRMSSDLSASEKAVLRRWSGASDMSIDLSADKKASESPVCTPVSAPQEKKVSNSNEGTPQLSSVAKPEIKVIPSMDRGRDNSLKGDSFNKFEQSFESNSNLGSGESDVLKDRVGGVTQSRSFMSRNEDQESSEDSFKTSTSRKFEGLVGIGNKGKLKVYRSGEQIRMTGVKYQDSSPTQIKPSMSEGGEQFESANQREGSESSLDSGPGSRLRKAFASGYKGIEGDSSSSHREVRYVGETEVTEKKESCMSENEDSGPQRLKFNGQGLTAELSKNARVKDDQIISSGNSRAQSTGPVEAYEAVDSFSTPPSKQAQRVRQSKGNVELNNDLKMKANELEIFFAEHKLRVPGEQSNSFHKEKLGDTQREASSSLHYRKPVVDIAPDNYTKAIDSQYDGDAINRKVRDLSVSEGSRGKFYDRYMQIRDAKLRKDWSTNREEKEAKLKSLQDSLERSRSEMMAKISGSADRGDSVSSAHRRAERIRSYNRGSITKREQKGLSFGDSEDDEEALDFTEHTHLHENKDDVSRGAQRKKHLSNIKNSSSTPRTSGSPVPKSATKNSTMGSGKQRMLPENPLAQSVPDFSEMRKENTKPSGANKATRFQVRSFARSKSISDEAAIVREDKSCRSQSSRKSSANPSDFREMCPVESDGACLAPVKVDEILKNSVTKPFLKKGSRTSFGARTINAWENASELLNNKEENCDVEFGPDEFVGTVKDGDEEFESLSNEDQNVFSNGEPKQKLVNSGSENGDSTLTFSLVGQALGSKLHFETMPDCSGESPVSWNSHTQHPFSYPHEISDIDGSVESPIGSPGSWNSHSVSQIETDSARMRKKWGTVQKPVLVVHSSNSQHRKDMTRGFKRLLKFGRKSRGSESLVDWISATTSEGDEDTEDGRDSSNRLSDDLRKSRMGYSHAQASEDSFNDGKFFNESVQASQNSIPAPPANFKLREDHISGSSIKAPRSFFSLSSFRSKGSDSKLR